MLTSEFDDAMGQIGGFEACPVIAVAVSGGGDSMALLLLAKEWADARDGQVVALTVDHGLRKESSKEARQVKRWCNQLGIRHHTLNWYPLALTSAVQLQAREARYRLLARWCKQRRVLHLLTAHHRDDQAETLFFRLARGSRLAGLSAMSTCRTTRNIRLIRPLLSIPKFALEKFLQARKQSWLHDPTNDTSDYTRNIIRTYLTSDLCERAAGLAAQFGSMRHYLENETARYLVQICDIFPQGYAMLHEQTFRTLPPDYALRALSALVQTMGGDPYAPRTEKLSRLCEELLAGRIKTKRSFAGCMFHYQPKNSCLLVYREANAVQSPVVLEASQEAVWDGRFRVSYETPSRKYDKIAVRALGTAGQALLKKRYESNGLTACPKGVLSALPSFWNLEELIAVPHIGYTDAQHRAIHCRARFVPAKALAGAAFFSLNRPETSHAHRKEHYA